MTMEWIKDGAEKPKNWPYQVRDRHCALKIKAILLNEDQSIEAFQGANEVSTIENAFSIDISKHANTSWNILRLEIDISLINGINTLKEVISEEKLDAAVFSICVHSVKTKYRYQKLGCSAQNLTDRILIDIDRQNISGDIFIKPEVILNQNLPAKDDKATRLGSRIIIGDPIIISVDEPPLSIGAGFDIKWDVFPKETKNSLYKLVYEHNETGRPRLFFNNGHSAIQPIVDSSATRGLKARIRDIVFATVAVDVWSELIQWAAECEKDEKSSGITVNILKSANKLTRIPIDDIKSEICTAEGRRDIQVKLQHNFLLIEKMSKLAEESQKE